MSCDGDVAVAAAWPLPFAESPTRVGCCELSPARTASLSARCVEISLFWCNTCAKEPTRRKKERKKAHQRHGRSGTKAMQGGSSHDVRIELLFTNRPPYRNPPASCLHPCQKSSGARFRRQQHYYLDRPVQSAAAGCRGVPRSQWSRSSTTAGSVQSRFAAAVLANPSGFVCETLSASLRAAQVCLGSLRAVAAGE